VDRVGEHRTHRLVIGTRGSALALWQARHVRDRLITADPSLEVELSVIKTKGDKILDVPLAKVGGKGLFVKEIEEALLRRDVDLAVHSMKDVPAEIGPGLVIAAVTSREDPHDVLVTRDPGVGLMSLPRGARVGTSSLRRTCQLHAQRPDLVMFPLRGNVDTRLAKLDAGEAEALVLAAAGLVRLGHEARITERLPFSISLPAIGQGVLALETREGDRDVRARVRACLHDPVSDACVLAERAFLARLGGGCQTPIAAHAVLADATLTLEGLVGDPSGQEILRDRALGPAAQAAALGHALAETLLARGADAILARCLSPDFVSGA
jgi:hydroxymethylbilane synthase